MIWNKYKLDQILNIIVLDELQHKYYVVLSPRPIIDEEFDVECTVSDVTNDVSTWNIKQLLATASAEYDKSEEVNAFYIGDETAWFDKATRVGLMNSLNMEKELNNTTSSIWINNKEYIINIDDMIMFLKRLEEYAKKVFDNTQRHKNAIMAIEERNDLFTYNVTTGYPEKITFNL